MLLSRYQRPFCCKGIAHAPSNPRRYVNNCSRERKMRRTCNLFLSSRDLDLRVKFPLNFSFFFALGFYRLHKIFRKFFENLRNVFCALIAESIQTSNQLQKFKFSILTCSTVCFSIFGENSIKRRSTAIECKGN